MCRCNCTCVDVTVHRRECIRIKADVFLQKQMDYITVPVQVHAVNRKASTSY